MHCVKAERQMGEKCNGGGKGWDAGISGNNSAALNWKITGGQFSSSPSPTDPPPPSPRRKRPPNPAHETQPDDTLVSKVVPGKPLPNVFL